jgi:hypothetical protein
MTRRRGSQSEARDFGSGASECKDLDQERRSAIDFDRGAARCKIFWIKAGEMQKTLIEAGEMQNLLHSRCVSTWLCVADMVVRVPTWLCDSCACAACCPAPALVRDCMTALNPDVP